MGGDVKEEALVLGAELHCDYGSVNSYLLTKDYALIGINGLPAEFVLEDCIPGVNITPFGDCTDGGPCESKWMLDDKWINSDEQKEKFGDEQIITTASHLVCNATGMFIKPMNSGQDGVICEQMLFLAQFDDDLLKVLCDPYGSLYSPVDLTEKAFAFLTAAIIRGGEEIDLSKFGKYPLEKAWDSLVGNKINMVDALTIMAINHLTGIDVTNAYRGPLDYPVAFSLMGINGLYGPTASKIFAEQKEINGILFPAMGSDKRKLNEATLEAIKSYSAETLERVNTSDTAKWAQENKGRIAGIEQILNGIMILVMAKVGTKSSPGNTVQYVDDAAGTAKGGAGGSVQFGSDTKSLTKLTNQMTQRGWTESTVRGTVSNPYTTRVSTNLATGNSATAYYNQSGSYVIVDNVTKVVVQISDNINPSSWIPDPNIINPYIPK